MSREYVDLLFTEYLDRKLINGRYSERAFAQALGLSPGFLKLLFQGKKHLSFERSKEIAGKLRWTEQKKQVFLKRVQEASLKNQKSLLGKVVVDQESFVEIADWFHFAIIELIKVKNGSVTIEQICKRLKLSKTEASFAIKHLLRVGMVKQLNASKFNSPNDYEIPSISHSGIRKYHHQMLTLASRSIEDQGMEKRNLRGLTLAFDSERIEEAKNEIQKFTSSFEKKFSAGKLDSVYQLSLAFFRLDEGEQK